MDIYEQPINPRIYRTNKMCCRCMETKDRSEFTRRTSSPDGLHYMCKVCSRKQNSIYNERDRNKDRARYQARNIRYRETHRAKPEYCARVMLHAAKMRAKKSGIEFNLTLADIVVPEVCPIFGYPLKKSKGTRSNNSPSLDRINPKLGYIRGNVMVISDRANRMKNDGTAREHELLANFLYSLEPKQ